MFIRKKNLAISIRYFVSFNWKSQPDISTSYYLTRINFRVEWQFMEISSYERRDRQYEILVNSIIWWWTRTNFFRSSRQIEKFIMLWSFMSVLCWLKGTVMKIKKLPEDSRSSKKIKSWNFCIPVIYNSEVILFRRLVFRYKSKHTKRCSFSFFLFLEPLVSR